MLGAVWFSLAGRAPAGVAVFPGGGLARRAPGLSRHPRVNCRRMVPGPWRDRGTTARISRVPVFLVSGMPLGWIGLFLPILWLAPWKS